MTTTTLIFVCAGAIVMFWSVGAYNRLIRLKSAIANAFAQIDVQLKRRYQLIPDLVEAAKKYLSHEEDMLKAVITARDGAKTASDAARAKPADAPVVTTLAAAEQVLSNRLGKLFASDETCPDLKGDRTFQDLREELTSTDHKFTFASLAFNDAVLDYNSAQSQFPAMLIAKLFSFAPSAMLQATLAQGTERAAADIRVDATDANGDRGHSLDKI